MPDNENASPMMEQNELSNEEVKQSEAAKRIVTKVRFESHVIDPKDMTDWIVNNFKVSEKSGVQSKMSIKEIIQKHKKEIGSIYFYEAEVSEMIQEYSDQQLTSLKKQVETMKEALEKIANAHGDNWLHDYEMMDVAEEALKKGVSDNG